MEFLEPGIFRYVSSHTMEENEFLRRIDRETHLYAMKPRMISGHLQGRVLSMLAQMIHPKYVLEIGTYTGYSALCLAEGMDPAGKLVTIDKNEELEERVMGYFEASGFNDLIALKVGDASDIIPTLDYDWDLVFMDADKINYKHYYQLLIGKMRSGSFMIIDNVLWSGKVLEKNRKKLDPVTAAVIDFNDYVHQDPQVENVLFPIRDGLMVLRKL